MRNYIAFCRKNGLEPSRVSSIDAYDRVRGFDPHEKIDNFLRKKRGGVCVDVRN